MLVISSKLNPASLSLFDNIRFFIMNYFYSVDYIDFNKNSKPFYTNLFFRDQPPVSRTHKKSPVVLVDFGGCLFLGITYRISISVMILSLFSTSIQASKINFDLHERKRVFCKVRQRTSSEERDFFMRLNISCSLIIVCSS